MCFIEGERTFSSVLSNKNLLVFLKHRKCSSLAKKNSQLIVLIAFVVVMVVNQLEASEFEHNICKILCVGYFLSSTELVLYNVKDRI